MSTPRSADAQPLVGDTHVAMLHSPPDDVGAVHDLLSRVWRRSPHVPVLERFRFETALVELTGNVFEHADAGHGLECTVTVTVTPDRLTATVVDSGVPLDGEVESRAMPDEFAECGRGLPLIHALVDEVTYVRDRCRNHWSLARGIPAPPTPANHE